MMCGINIGTLLLLLAANFILGFKWELEMIHDFLITGDLKSFTVNIYSCWGKEQKYNFSKRLFEKNVFTSNAEMQHETVKNVYPHFNSKFVLDLDCPNFHNILFQANQEKLFSRTNSWLLISQKPYRSQALKNTFLQYDIFVDSNVILAEKASDNGDKNGYTFREIYKICAQSTEVTENVIANWNNNNTALVYLNNFNAILADRRRNLQKIQLGASIVILDNDTLNHLEDYRDIHIDSITKVNYILTKHLIEYANASLILYPVDSWGYLDNKTENVYTGMIGSTQRNESEICGTALFVTKDRVSLIDYIAMTTPTKVRFVFRQPPLSYAQNIFTLPFTTSLWMSAFVLVVLAILLLYTAVWWENEHPNDSDSDKGLRTSLLDVVMLTVGAVAQQGAPAEPRNASGKIIMLFTFIALMFLYVSYSANIVALLQSSATNIRTLDNLLESRLKLGADDTVYNRYYMSTASDRTQKAIYDTKIAPPGEPSHFIPLGEGVKRLREGFYAFHMELGRGYKLVADTFLENEKCGLQEIDFLSVVDAYFSIKKNSTFKEMFKLGLRKLREGGIQARELSKIYTNKPECHSAGGNFLSVGLVDSYPAFLFLATGIAVSVLLFLLEILVHKKPVSRQ